MESAQVPSLPGHRGLFFGPLLREVTLRNRYEEASGFRSNVFQQKHSILKTLKRSNIAFLLEINRTLPYLKVKASHNVQRDAELGHINPFAVARAGSAAAVRESPSAAEGGTPRQLPRGHRSQPGSPRGDFN